jgi:hypothetical protein
MGFNLPISTGVVLTEITFLARLMCPAASDVLDHGFFYTRPVNPGDAEDDDYFHVRYTTDQPLLAFKSLLLQGLATFQWPPQSWVPAVDPYFSHQPQWHEQVPTGEAGGGSAKT